MVETRVPSRRRRRDVAGLHQVKQILISRRWSGMRGNRDYALFERGCRGVFKRYRLQTIVKKYADHVSVPVLMQKMSRQGRKTEDEAGGDNPEFEVINELRHSGPAQGRGRRRVPRVL